MSSPNHPNNHDGNINPHARVPADPDTNRAVAYRDGYVHGRVNERDTQYESLEVRDNDNAARGLLIGIALTSLVGLALGALFFFNQRQENTLPDVQIIPEAPQPQQQQQPEKTIIERQIERVPQIIPVPQQQAPQQQAPQQTAPAPQPDVNITVPSAPAPPQGTTQQDTTINVTPPQAESGSDSGTAPEAPSSPSTSDPAGTTAPGAGTGAQ